MKESFSPEGVTNGPLSLVDGKEDKRGGWIQVEIQTMELSTEAT